MMSPEDEVASHLALALDTDDLVVAGRWAHELREFFGIAKVGLELYSAAGPDAIEVLVEAGFRVFCDLKLHDIPNTVGRAAQVVGGLGASYLTVHTAGGPDMVRAAVEGLLSGAEAAAMEPPMALGVTVLTSDPKHSAELVAGRLEVAVEGGCGGVVCSADDLATLGQWCAGRRMAPDALLAVVPGIRPEGVGAGDQLRVATPGEALRRGAGVLVVGRAVTAAVDRRQAAQALYHEARRALT